MAYQGYLIKVGDYTIPLKYIRAETYKVTKFGQDLDSYTDANGYLHRNALEHWVPKAEFETIPLMTNVQVANLMGNIQRNYISQIEKDANVTLYVPEIDDYYTTHMYMPDIEYEMYLANDKIIQYEQFRMAFIGY